MVLAASGVRYLAEQNGYICLGSFFGNIIIQWVKSTIPSGKTYNDISFPITFAKAVYQIIPVDWDSSNTTTSKGYTFSVVDTMTTLTGARIVSNNTSAGYYKVLIIGM